MLKQMILTMGILSGLFSLPLKAQSGTAKLVDWKMLSDVKFEDRYYPEYESWYLTPVFSSKLQKLDGQQVIIKGYIIPLDVGGDAYALSAYPFSACFFCGGAGPESVMSLHFADNPRRYKTDEILHLSGTLILNDEELEEFTYILKNVREVK